MSEYNSSDPEIRPRGRSFYAVSELFLNDVEIMDESQVIEILYGKPENSDVKVVPKEPPAPQDVIDRLIADTDIHEYTADQINYRKDELLNSDFPEVSEDNNDEIVEFFAKRILISLKSAIDASRINNNTWIRLEVGTLHNRDITRQAIKLAAAAMSSVDSRNIRVIPYPSENGAEVNGLDIVLPKSPLGKQK